MINNIIITNSRIIILLIAKSIMQLFINNIKWIYFNKTPIINDTRNNIKLIYLI